MEPKVSIITGIYNCADTLDEAVTSILNQTFTDWEMIMCDDGSSDNTYEKAKEYEKKYPGKFVVIKNEHNIGLNATLNRCLKLSKGEYIARMDGDDISVTTRLEKEVAVLDKHPEFAVVSSPMIYFDESGDWGEGTAIEYPQKNHFCTHAPFFCHAPAMIRKSVFAEVGGYSENKHLLRVEDCDLWYKIYAAGYKGYNLQEPLYKMRDDRNAKNRRTASSRFNGIYVTFLGFKRVKMPLWRYVYAVKIAIVELIKIVIPNRLYDVIHHVKQGRDN